MLKQGEELICKNCGLDIIPYFRGSKIVWRHKNRARYCDTQPMYVSKAEPRVD